VSLTSAEATAVVPSGGSRVSFRALPPPDGTAGVPYFFSFCGFLDTNGGNCMGAANLSGGSAPYHFQLETAGGFPPFGLTLGINGNLTGTPSTADVRSFGVCAVDLGGNSSCDRATVTIVDCTAPAAPTGLSATASGNAVTVSWNASNGANEYVVEAGTATGSSSLANMSVGNLTRVTGTLPNGTYFIRVRARSRCGTSTASAEVTVQVGSTAPPAPTPTPTPTPTRPSVGPTSQNLGEVGGCQGGTLRATVNIQAPANVTWTATHSGSSIVSWARLSFGPASGTGSGSIAVTINVPPQQPSSRTFTCNDYTRFNYGDTITVRFSTNDVGRANFSYTYLGLY
jgi:hypothetical protein